jgi:Abortive infection alpha
MGEEWTGVAQVLGTFERLTREAREPIRRLFGPIADAAGERIADKINAGRSVNLDRIAMRVLLMMHDTQAQQVPLAILVPVIQQSSLEDREELVSMWAGLLASAASGHEIHTAYPKILAEITPMEARLLDTLYRWETTSEDEGHRDLTKHANLSEKELPVAGINLGLRHGLINGAGTSLWKPDLTKWNNIRLTPLGTDFVRVCRGPLA